jgi:hypothetical protein
MLQHLCKLVSVKQLPGVLKKIYLTHITHKAKTIMLKNKLHIYIILFCICFAPENNAGEKDISEHSWQGNLALPVSQQPGPLIALGQNIIGKNDFIVFLDHDHIQGKCKKYETVTPLFLYGINDHSSLFITIPIATHYKENNQRSSGIGDITLQYEYAYFTKNRFSYSLQGTVLANIGLPTGSFKKNPATGFGSTSFFAGTTFNYLAIDWYAYGSTGTTIATSHHGNKHGNQYFYQAGFGKNIAYRSKKWILTGIFEFNGLYEKRDKINNITNENSGENIILGGYTLWFSTKKLIVIGDISIPLTQHFFGKQNKVDYTFELIAAWKFN